MLTLKSTAKNTYKCVKLREYDRDSCIGIVVFLRLLKGTPCFVDQPSSKSAKHVELLTWVGRQSKVVSVSKQGRVGIVR